MDETKLNSIYQSIAETVNETIPEEWSKVFLYGEINEFTRTAYFYYYPLNENIPVYNHNIPDLFDIPRGEYRKLWYQLLDGLEELWYEFKNNNQVPWTNLTLILESDGKFKIEYDYKDLSNADDYERKIIWKYKYLGLIPEDENDREFLETYLQSIKENEDNK